jgi:hypothetical protein
MVATVGSISIDLSTNVAKFASGFKSAATTVDRESGRMAKSIARVDRASKAAGSVLSGFVGGIAAGGALAAISSLSGAIGKASKALEDFEEIGNRAKTVGLRNDTFQAISFGALQADVSQEKLNSSLEIFAKNIGLAEKGGGALFTSLKRLNPELLQTLLTTNDQELRLRKVAEAFAQTSDATERAALATAVFGKGGIDMVRVLEGGSQAIAKLKREAKDLGVIVPDELIEKAGMLDDKLAALGKIIDINISQALVNAAPFLVSATEGMAAFAKKVNETSIEITKFAENPSLETLASFLDWIFEDRSFARSGILGAIRDALTHDAATVIKEINSIEDEIKELQETGAGGAGIVIEQDLQRLEQLRAELAALRSESIVASENSARAAHRAIRAGTGSRAAPTTGSNPGSDVPVTRYSRDTAENTERAADTLEDQSTAYKGYFDNLEETLKNDVTGSITKYIQQLIYAQELAGQTISEAVQTSILGRDTASGGRQQYSISKDSQLDFLLSRVNQGQQTAMADTGDSAPWWESMLGGKNVTYAGAFAEGGSFTAPGNQSGDTTRLLMDVNGGERVTVEKGGADSITLNFYAAPGESEATMRQRARQAGEVISRELSRA